MGFFSDILKEQEQGGRKFSQGRIYLFISFLSFILINILLSIFAFCGITVNDKETLILVSTNLKWALGSFSLYVLGTKGISSFSNNDNGYHKPYKPYQGHNDHYGHQGHNGHYGYKSESEGENEE